jgi:hypothetical protein
MFPNIYHIRFRLLFQTHKFVAYKCLSLITVLMMVLGPVTPVAEYAFAQTIDEQGAADALEVHAPDELIQETSQNPELDNQPEVVSNVSNEESEEDVPLSDESIETSNAPIENVTENSPVDTTAESATDALSEEVEEGSTEETSEPIPVEPVPTNIPEGETVPVPEIEDGTDTLGESDNTDMSGDGTQNPDATDPAGVTPIEQSPTPEELRAEEFVFDGSLTQPEPGRTVAGDTVRIQVADYTFPDKQDGERITNQEAFAALLGITTQRKDLAPQTGLAPVVSSVVSLITGEFNINEYSAITDDAEKIEAITDDLIVEDSDIEEYITVEATKETPNADTGKIETSVLEIPTENITFEAGSVDMVIRQPQGFVPGVYTLTYTIQNPITGEIEEFSQDFEWGVLTMNTDKDVYAKGEEATIDIGVLDDVGEPACDAQNTLTVFRNGDDELPTGDGIVLEVQNTETCTTFDSQNIVPDFTARYTFTEVGSYTFELLSDNGEGTKRLTEVVHVEEVPPFIVERHAATRLYPVGFAPSTITVHFNSDFTGDVSEFVPAEFELKNIRAFLNTSSPLSIDEELVASIVNIPIGVTVPVDESAEDAVEESTEEDDNSQTEELSVPEVETDASTGNDEVIVDQSGESIHEVVNTDAPTTAETINTEAQQDVPQSSESFDANSLPVPGLIQTTSNSEESALPNEPTPALEALIETITSFIQPEIALADANDRSVIVSTQETRQILTVPGIVAQKGDTLTIVYEYNAPDISPMFYSLGPVELNSAESLAYTEARLWGIANDTVCTWIGGTGTWDASSAKWSGCGGSVPDSTDDVVINGAVVASSGSKSIASLSISNGTLTMGSSDSLTVAGNVTISTAGTLNTTGALFSLSGDFTNIGTYTCSNASNTGGVGVRFTTGQSNYSFFNSGTITNADNKCQLMFTNASALAATLSISGNFTFGSLIVSDVNNDGFNTTLELGAGNTITLTGQLNLQGVDATNDKLIVKSSSPGLNAQINMSGTASKSGSTDYGEYQDIYIIDNSTGFTPPYLTTPSNSVDNGNNFNVFTVAPTPNHLTGTVGGGVGANITVRLLKNGVDTGLTDDTDASGNYDINITSLSGTIITGDILTLFLDNETPNGVLIATVNANGLNAYSSFDFSSNQIVLL